MQDIHTTDLTFAFDQQAPVIDHVNTCFTTGSCNLLVGPSGCGKSTFLRLLAGLLPKYGGHLLSGKVTGTKGLRIGMLFQDPAMQFALDTPRHELEFCLENLQVQPDQMTARIDEALAFCHIEELANRRLNTLSGGQQQRAALAVIIAMRPHLLLLDEPFASIDEENRRFLINQLVKLRTSRDLTIIITDHDCHGYQPLAPQVWTADHHDIHQLSPAAGSHLLATADRQATVPLTTSLPPADSSAVFQLTDLRISRGIMSLLDRVNLPLIKNKVTLLTGPNGVGKSTLFKALTKLVPYQGQISYQGNDIQQLSPRRYYQQVGLVFQEANDQFLNVTVSEELALSLKHCHQAYFTNNRLHQALVDLGLDKLVDRVVYSLSGGQKKKLQLLLMLMSGQPVLLLDEPFTGLDQDSLAVVIHLIKQCQTAGPQTIIMISHQLAGLSPLVDYHLVLSDRQLSYQGGAKQ